jgi:hypothetical protein
MRGYLAAIVAAFMLCAPSTGHAKAKADISFAFPTDKPAKIVVFRPDVKVGSLGVGGVEEPNAEWTATARTNLSDALKAHQSAKSNEIIFLGDQEGEAATTIADYQALFRAVASSLVQHQFGFGKLPTKKGTFDWTLGPGAAKLGELTGGNYGLFLFTHDSYGTAGRKVAQVLMAGLFGGYMPAGIHISYAALVDFETGKLVWFNLDPGSGGDPRETDGAAKRIDQLLSTMPSRSGAVPGAGGKSAR